MQRQAFERDGEVYYVEHHEHGRVMIYGPAPPQEASSLVLLLQPATSHDKHAVRRGVSRRVVTGQHALDEVSWVDTRLSDAEVAGLFDGPSGDAVAGVVRYRRGRLRIRPKWTTLEFRPRGKPKSREVEALVDGVAHIARAARGLPEDRASVSEDPFPASSFLVYLAIVYCVFGLPWLFQWARLDQSYVGFLGAMTSVGAVASIGAGALMGMGAGAIARWFVRRHHRGYTHTHRLASACSWVVATWVIPTVSTALILVNLGLDRSPPQTYRGVVETYSYSPKNNVVTGLCVRHERDRYCVAPRYPLDSNILPDPQGKSANVTLRAGALGWPWIERFVLGE